LDKIEVWEGVQFRRWFLSICKSFSYIFTQVLQLQYFTWKCYQWCWIIPYTYLRLPVPLALPCVALIKNGEAGLVLSVRRILRAALTKFRVYVCMCNYSSQTTEPICIEIIPANRACYADCHRLLRFKIFTPPYL